MERQRRMIEEAKMKYQIPQQNYGQNQMMNNRALPNPGGRGIQQQYQQSQVNDEYGEQDEEYD